MLMGNLLVGVLPLVALCVGWIIFFLKLEPVIGHILNTKFTYEYKPLIMYVRYAVVLHSVMGFLIGLFLFGTISRIVMWFRYSGPGEFGDGKI